MKRRFRTPEEIDSDQYSPLRPLINAKKLRISGMPYDEQNLEHQQIYNDYKERMKDYGWQFPEDREVANLVINNIAKNKIGGEHIKQYSAPLQYVNLLKPQSGLSVDGGGAKGVYSFGQGLTAKGKPEYVNSQQAVINLQHPSDEFFNPLSTLTHEGIHALDDSFMRTYQKTIPKFLGELHHSSGMNNAQLKDILDQAAGTIHPNLLRAYLKDKNGKSKTLYQYIGEDFEKLKRGELGYFREQPHIDSEENNLDFQAAHKALKTLKRPSGDAPGNPRYFGLQLSEYPAHIVQNLRGLSHSGNEGDKLIHRILTKLNKKFNQAEPNFEQDYPLVNKLLTDKILEFSDPRQLDSGESLPTVRNRAPEINQSVKNYLQQQQIPFGHPSSQPVNQFSQFGQQPAQRQNRFDRPQSRNRSNQQEEEKREEDQYGNPLATGGSASNGLGSLYDYINQRYAGGGGVGLGNMGRFFGLYPKINY